MYNPTEALSERMTEVSNLESPIVKTDAVMPIDNSAMANEQVASGAQTTVMSQSESEMPAATVGAEANPIGPATTAPAQEIPVAAEIATTSQSTDTSVAAPTEQVYAVPQVIQDSGLTDDQVQPATSDQMTMTDSTANPYPSPEVEQMAPQIDPNQNATPQSGVDTNKTNGQ